MPVRSATTMSHPSETYNHEIVETLKSLDMAYSRTVQSAGVFRLPDNFLEWHPTCHHKDNLLERTEQFKQYNYPLGIFYVWGHSYEFERVGNWDLIENFCSKIAGDAAIWYATNIEIYDYVTALRRLEFSADSSLVKKPNAVPLWLKVDDIVEKIMPGELRKL